jgi:uncharacterized protein YjeT (DUF2065 family)
MLAILAAAVHGGAGEVLVVRRLPLAALPPSPFGGPRMTKAMVHAAWHMTTVAFLTIGCALVVAGAVVGAETARGIGIVGASAFTGFAALAVGVGAADAGAPRALLRHPGPMLLAATAGLAWWGAFW